MRCLILALVLVIFGCKNLAAQTWDLVEQPPHAKSVVKIISSDSSGGSGAVVKKLADSKDYEGFYLGLIVTASHCVSSMEVTFHVVFFDGSITKNAIPVKDLEIRNDPGNDLAVIKALIPNSVPVTEISSASPKCDEEVLLSGYGAGEVRHWSAKYGGRNMMTLSHIIFSWAIQGDSGGPVVYNGKIVGVICYGDGIKRYKETKRMIVGPIYSSNILRIKEFIDEYKTTPPAPLLNLTKESKK